MQIESTASQTFQNDFIGNNPSATNKYLINTTKALKGHKMKTQDFIKLQLLKFRQCSPVKYQELLQPQYPSQSSEYSKFKRSIDNQDEISKVVKNSRQKISTSSKKRIKMFNNTKINSMLHDNSLASEHPTINYKSKPVSSHNSQHPKNDKNFKTIFNQSKTVHVQHKKGIKKKHIVFRSQNLGTKMNDYLNLYINNDKEEQTVDGHQTLHEEPQTEQENNNYTLDFFRKKPNTAYLRRMKKYHKSKENEVTTELYAQFRSQTLTKPSTALPTFKRNQLMIQNKDR